MQTMISVRHFTISVFIFISSQHVSLNELVFYYFDGGNVGSDPGNEGFPGKREAEKVKENQFIV